MNCNRILALLKYGSNHFGFPKTLLLNLQTKRQMNINVYQINISKTSLNPAMLVESATGLPDNER